MRIKIGRMSGPVTDHEAEFEIEERELETVKDVLAAVNVVSRGKENWYVEMEDGDREVPVSEGLVSRRKR